MAIKELAVAALKHITGGVLSYLGKNEAPQEVLQRYNLGTIPPGNVISLYAVHIIVRPISLKEDES
jgi:hypothetical protein